MKNILLLFLFISLFSCKKDSLGNFNGSVDATKDGAIWNSKKDWTLASVAFSKDDSLFIKFALLNEENFYRELISFDYMPKKIGTYCFKSSLKCDKPKLKYAYYYLMASDGDVVRGSYTLDSLYNNQLTIDKIDEKKQEISGTFELRFVKTSGAESVKDIVKFEKGVYKTKLTPQ
jgi:hypothetical protein